MLVQFYVPKSNATLADSLTVLGLAQIVNELLLVQTGLPTAYHIRIGDLGSCYGLDCEPTLEAATIDRCHPLTALAPLIRTVKNAEQLAEIDPRPIDYEAEKRTRDEYLAFRKANPKADKNPDLQMPNAPHHNWDIFRAINPAVLPGYNNVLLDWRTALSAQPDVLRLLLDLFSQFPPDFDRAIKQWKALDKANGWGIPVETTTLQLYNPEQGKGQNRAKADALSMGNVKGFWLLEFLKIVGLYHAGITRTLRGVKDRKTYVIAPVTIDFEDSESILSKFKESMQVSRPAITSDILAAISYVKAMLFYAEQRQSVFWQLFNPRPRNVVSGFYTAFYKDLGNAVVTMNLSFIGLPNWIAIRSSADVQQTQEVLEEIERLTWTIDEDHSNGFALLGALRDFISGCDLARLFDFTSAYAGYYMGRRERNQYAHQLSTDFIRSVVVGTDEKLAQIFESEGFKNVAYAIRQSTVTAQYRKGQNDRRYDVRYGLGQELARKAHYADEFVAALADFLHKYNAENAQVMERAQQSGRSGPFRRNVKTSDIEEVIALIDKYGALLIANLLIAYGYARLPQQQPDAPIPLPSDQSAEAEPDTAPTEDYE